MSEKCKETVYDRGGWPHPYQCKFKAWKDGYCKIHHPDSVKARRDKQEKRYEEQRAKSPYVLLHNANERIVQLERENAELRKDAELKNALLQRAIGSIGSFDTSLQDHYNRMFNEILAK